MYGKKKSTITLDLHSIQLRNCTIHFIHFILVIYLIFIIDVIFTLSSIIHLTWKLTGLVKPQPVVPLAVFFPGNLPVLGGGIKADVP